MQPRRNAMATTSSWRADTAQPPWEPCPASSPPSRTLFLSFKLIGSEPNSYKGRMKNKTFTEEGHSFSPVKVNCAKFLLLPGN